MLDDMFRILTEWWERRLAIHRLEVLDDRLLADMGIRRKDIACHVAHPQDC